MSNAITKGQERYIEDCLVEIIVEPEQYGVEEAKENRDAVIDVLEDLVNRVSSNKLSDNQVAEVYDRIMNGDIENTIHEYFSRNLYLLKEICISLYYRLEDYSNLYQRHLSKTKSEDENNDPQKFKEYYRLMEETLELLEGSMVYLNYLYSCKNSIV